MIMSKLSLLSAGVGLAIAAFPASVNLSPANQTSHSLLSPDTAEARVGRPLTPGSVAGVNRRVNRRAYRRDYYGGNYDGGGYYGGGYYGPGAGLAAGAVAAGAVAAGAATTTGVAPAEPMAAYPPSAPDYVPDAVVVEPGLSATVIHPVTGRRCTISTDGRHWCWTP